MLSVSSPFTVITFDEEAVDAVLADMTKITTLSSLFSGDWLQLLHGAEGTWRYTQCLSETASSLFPLLLCQGHLFLGECNEEQLSDYILPYFISTPLKTWPYCVFRVLSNNLLAVTHCRTCFKKMPPVPVQEFEKKKKKKSFDTLPCTIGWSSLTLCVWLCCFMLKTFCCS